MRFCRGLLPWGAAILLALGVAFARGEACAAEGPGRYLEKPDDWFRSSEGRQVTAAVLSHQSPAGGWPKNVATARPFTGDARRIQPTFDNGATTDELRYLARAYAATRDEILRTAFERGWRYVLAAQYANGGWPQFHPPPAHSYHRHITFNDHAMARLMEFVREVARHPRYEFLGGEQRRAAHQAFERGLDCIVKCQVRVKGTPTAWCAQHDAVDLSPRSGRSYELVSLSGSESVRLVEVLMSVERPSPEIVAAVEGAVAWLDQVKLTGVRVVERQVPGSPTGKDRMLEADPKAGPLWARFYEIGTNRPLFSDRDGVKRYTLAEIGHERRNGYAWYGGWATRLLERDYPAWKQRVGASGGLP